MTGYLQNQPRRVPNLTPMTCRIRHPNTVLIATAASHDYMADAVWEALSANSTILQPLITSVVNNIMKSPEIFTSLVDAVTKAVTEKITQSIYDYMLHDIACTHDKVNELKNSIKELKIANEKLEQELDN